MSYCYNQDKSNKTLKNRKNTRFTPSKFAQANATKQRHHNSTHNHSAAHPADVSAWTTWSTDMESAIDSSFFWGYLVTQIPGGFLASFFPANRIFGAAIVGSAFCNMFIPLCIYLNPIILICVRVIQGLVEVCDRFDTGQNRFPNENAFTYTGCNLSVLPWHLALLGATVGEISAGDDCFQWLLCRCRDRTAGFWVFSCHQLAGTLLLLQYSRVHLVRLQPDETQRGH